LLTAHLLLAQAAQELLEPGSSTLSVSATRTPWTAQELGIEQAQPTNGLAWLAAERASLVAAVSQADAHSFGRLAWLMADAVVGFFAVRAYWTNWESTHDTALHAAMAAGDRLGEAITKRNLARLYKEQSRWQAALDYFDEAADGLETLGEPMAA